MGRRSLWLLAAVISAGLGLLWLGRNPIERGQTASPKILGPASDSKPVERRAVVDVPPPTTIEAVVAGRESVQGPATEAIPLAAWNGRLEVLVLSAQTSEPVAGRRLVVLEPEPRPDWIVQHVDASTGDLEHAPRTGTSGRATFILPPGSYRVVCPGTGGFSLQEGQLVENLTAGETRELLFSIPFSPFDFIGRVEDAMSREPIAGTTVALLQVSALPTSSDASEELRTDARGVFQAKSIPESAISAIVSAPGYAPESVVIEAGHETEERAALVLLKPFARLRVELRDANGSSLAGVEVRLLSEPQNFLWETEPEVVARAETDASGIAVLNDLPPDRPLLPGVVLQGVLMTGFATPLVLAAGEERHESWRTGGRAILGRVLDQAGEPVPDQIVWVEPAMEDELDGVGRDSMLAQIVAATRSDETGGFAFPWLAPGDWWVGLAEDAFSDSALPPVRVKILAAEGIENVVLRSPRQGPSIRGHVEDEQGRRVSVMVSASGPMDIRAEADDQGIFELGPLLPASYTLSAFDGDRSASVADVLAGAEDVRLVLHQGIVLEGEIVDGVEAEGQAFLGGLAMQGFGMTSVKNGRFSFENLSSGSYGLVVRLEDGRCALQSPVVLESSGLLAPLQIEVREGARLRIVRKDLTTDLQVRVDGLFAGLVLGSHSSVDLVLPPGICTIETFEGTVMQTLTLAAGEFREVQAGSEK